MAPNYTDMARKGSERMIPQKASIKSTHRGVSARPHFLAVAAAHALCLLLSAGMLTASASAASLHTETAFSPIDGSGIGANIRGASSLAVDEATGNVFLADTVNDVVYIIGSEGGVPTGVAPPYEITGVHFNPSAFRQAVAVDNSATSPSQGAVYLLEQGGIKKYVRNPGTEQYEAAGELVAVPPVGNGSGDGITVDGSGNVYVCVEGGGTSNHGLIVKFSPSGTQLARLEMTAATELPKALALDSAGDLFVLTDNFKVFKFPVNGLGELEASNFVSVLATGQPESVAVNKVDNTLFVAPREHITEFDATTLAEKGDFTSTTTVDSEAVIALNSTAGFLYMFRGRFFEHDLLAFNLDGPTLADAGTTDPSEVTATGAGLNGVVNPEGVAVGECKFLVDEFASGGPTSLPCEGALPTDSADHAVSADVSGLAPNSFHGYRLVVTNGNGSNRTGLKFFSTEPIAETTAATAITPAGATLNGIVRPEGSALSECKFEFGPTTDYGTTVPCEPEAGAIPADSAPHQVSAQPAGLVVGTTYHYRVVASGGLGSEAGEDFSFTTLGPSVIEQFFSGLTETSVKLEALINPRGKATTYHFEYGPDPCDANPCTSVPVPDEAIGSGSTAVGVAQAVNGLSPGGTYHYRVVVANSDGVGHSADGTFTTYGVPSIFDPCPNDAFRLGRPSALLPDCRAYEQATPVDKNGADVTGTKFLVQASLAGDGITSQTKGGLPGAEGAQTYPIHLSQRGAGTWSTQGLLPPPSFGERAQVLAWTPDLRFSLSRASFAGSDEVNSPDNALLLRDNATHAIQQLTPYSDEGNYALAGASADDSKIFFEARGSAMNLTGNAATGKDNLYLWDRDSEELSLVGVLPGGSAPPGGSFAGPFNWWSHFLATELKNGGALGETVGASDGYLTQDLHAISADGSKAFFTAGATGQVYLREGIGGESPETIRISASQRAVPDPGGAKPAIFMGAATDGSVAIFASCQKLTDDSTAHSTAANDCQMPEQGQDLYAYDTGSGQLSDLTVDAGDPQGAEVKGVLGTSEDGSYVYFLANGDLDGAGAAETGDCLGPPNDNEGISWHGECSLYLWHAGAISFIARLNGSDSLNWKPGGSTRPSLGSVSADGKTALFQTTRQLTDYGNTPRGGCQGASDGGVPLPCAQFYRFHVGDPELRCVTCNPTGAPPSGIAPPTLRSIEVGVTYFRPPLRTRNLAASGDRFFFETADKLVGADVNGDDGCPMVSRPVLPVPSCQDVYEWEAPGTVSCTEASPAFSDQDGGCIYLLSPGTSPDPSFFGDASRSGDDVFIFTGSRLVPGDEDELFDIYDASVGGGLASQNQPPPKEPCEGQGCRGSVSPPPPAPSAGSAGFSGPGDPPVKHKKPPKKHHKHHHKKKKHHKHHKGGAKQRAGANQGGQK
jgi:hypothetical protein